MTYLVINNAKNYAAGKELYAVEAGQLVTYVVRDHRVYDATYVQRKLADGTCQQHCVTFRRSVRVSDVIDSEQVVYLHLRPTVVGAWRAAADVSKLRLRRLQKAREVAIAELDRQIDAELGKYRTAAWFCQRAHVASKQKHSTKAK
jgi:hypothetical protein